MYTSYRSIIINSYTTHMKKIKINIELSYFNNSTFLIYTNDKKMYQKIKKGFENFCEEEKKDYFKTPWCMEQYEYISFQYDPTFLYEFFKFIFNLKFMEVKDEIDFAKDTRMMEFEKC